MAFSSSTPSGHDSAGYQRFCEFLQERTGIVLGDAKQYLVTSRLSGLMREHNITGLSDLVERLRRGQPMNLLQAVIDAMTTNETMWFRDGYPFEVIKREVFSNWNSPEPVKIWCAACSSGQEPYSLTMVSEEYKLEPKMRMFPGIRITATDISAAMLTACKEGVYDGLAVARGLSDERKRRFFDALPNGRWRIKDALKASVSFQSLNLLHLPYAVGPFDVIFCRNVLIYFSPEIKNRVLSGLMGRLKKGGLLFLGGSESLGELSDRFEMIRCNPGIAYRLR